MWWCTALDRELKDRYDGHKVVKLFFELNDDLGQMVEIGLGTRRARHLCSGPSRDSCPTPWTPGEWAPMLSLAAGALACLERLQKRGYELDRDDTLTIVKFFSKRKLFKMSADLAENWYDHEKFAQEAKEIMVKPSLSLYDLIELSPDEAAKLLAYQDYYDFACSIDEWPKIPRGYRDACAAYLTEQLSRRFCRLWALDSF
ncbi:hypothetical protein TKK_0014975 [Trichogramma kaykai]